MNRSDRLHWLPGLYGAAVAIVGLAASSVWAMCGDNLVSAGFCLCDCNGDGDVTVDEVLTAINIGLGNASIDGPVYDEQGVGRGVQCR